MRRTLIHMSAAIAVAGCGGDTTTGQSDSADVTSPDSADDALDGTSGDSSDDGTSPDATADDSADSEGDADVACTPGELGCACDADHACAETLVCDADLCRLAVTCDAVVCVAHQLCGQVVDGADAACLPACDSGYTWNANTLACDANPVATCADNPSDPNAIGDDCDAANKECVSRSGDVPAHCGDCLSGFVENAGTNACRAPETCADIGADCDTQHRLCIAATTSPAADAHCGACVAPYADAGVDVCVVDSAADCSPDGDNSLYAICAAAHRECDKSAANVAPSCGDCAAPYAFDASADACAIPATCADIGCSALGRGCTDDGFATCEGCLDGLSPTAPQNPMSACVESLSCDNLDCGSGFCIESDTPGIDATCAASTCGANQAYDQADDECVNCSGSCNKAGQTGRFWLYTRTNGTCVCETTDDWYIDTTLGATPKPCDADGDGWVRTSALPFMEPTGSLDPAIAANARCDVHVIDRITLQNEWSQRYEVRLCSDGKLAGESDNCAQTRSISLYEKTELDDDASLTDRVKYPVYGDDDSGRALTASELNPLTKACVSDSADFDGNGIDDISEAAEMTVPSGVTLTDLQHTLLDFGYFMEMHTSWYEPRPGEDGGTIVIAERSRCDSSGADAFPLVYGEAGGSTYWRECTRNRRAAFDRDAIQPGFDFARWQCSATSGTCTTPAAPASVGSATVAPAHGLCDVVLPPADGEWRGMTHHSQFRCAEITSGAAQDAWQIARTDLYDATSAASAKYQYDLCVAAGAEADHGAQNPTGVGFDCSATRPEAGAVGFVAVRYQDDTEAESSTYKEGCIDEWNEWPELCPGWDRTLADEDQSATGDGQSGDFGELICGCGENYGGLYCETGCSDTNLLLSPGYGVSPRSGWWLCGDMKGSACTETCADAFAYDDMAAAAQSWTRLDQAVVDGSILRVTPDVAGATGAAWYDNRVMVANGFTIDFTFEFVASTGSGADGMAFVIQPNGYVTGTEGGTGAGLTLGFDTFQNPGESTPSSIGLFTASTLYGRRFLTTDLSNSGQHTIHMTYAGTTLTVTLDGGDLFTATLDLKTAGAASNDGRSYIGFTARTGGEQEAHNVTKFAFACGANCETPEQTASDGDGAVWTLDGGVNRFGIEASPVYSGTTACSALGIVSGIRGSGEVCGWTNTAACPGLVTYADATTACSAVGLRLCTLDELHADEPRATGCGYDNARVWTSTACDNGVYTSAGASTSLATYPDQCDAETSTANVRCCGDDVPTTGWSLR